MEVSVIQTLKDTKPALLNEFDAIVVVLHCVMRELGFRCVGLSESKPESNNNAEAPIPEGWNASSGDSYSFRYKHNQSSMTFILKVLVMNDKLLVHGLAKEDNKIQTLELSVKDFIKEKAGLETYENLYNNLDNLIALFKINVTSKLLPMLNKPGYEAGDTNTTRNTTNPENQQRREEPRYDPYRDPLLVHDPLRIPGTGRGPIPVPGGFGVGYADRFGPSFPGLGPIDPGAMGNLVGPNHPGFGGRFNGPDPNYGLGGPRLPRGAVPPGARFEPFGPPPPGALNPNFRNQFGPDNDDLPPPGYDNMYL